MHQGAGREQSETRSLIADGVSDAGHARGLIEAAEASRVEASEEVVLAPHDALGHPGGAAGVEHDQVIRGPLRRQRKVASGLGGYLLVGGRPVGACSGAIVDEEPALDLVGLGADAFDALGERAMEHDSDGIGIVPEVEQLFVAVSVVGVDRDESDPKAGEHALHVFGAVVEVERHLVLMDSTKRGEPPGNSGRSGLKLPPRDGALTLDDGWLVRLDRGDRLPGIGVVPLGHNNPPRSAVSLRYGGAR